MDQTPIILIHIERRKNKFKVGNENFFLNVGILMLELMLELGLGLGKMWDSSGPDSNKGG